MRVTIPQGSSLAEIADRLEQSGVIEDAGFFQLRARINGDSGNLRPGPYEFREDMSFSSALDVLKEGVPPDVVQVGIPEGLSRKEIAPLTGGCGGATCAAPVARPRSNPRAYGAKGATSLEGFLFPSTYELKKGQTVARLRRPSSSPTFKRNFEKVDLRYAQAQEPHALRRPDHRVAGRARGAAAARSGRSSPR